MGKTPRERPPCRLYFLLAREAPVGVLFRRGPSQWTQLVRWNLEEDTFEPGQWFKGRLYEKRADLSPDGTKLIYFARKLNARTLADREYTYAWTAISRPPYLTALALWPKGDCWNGGGLFATDTRVWLNHFKTQARAHANHPPKGLEVKCHEGERGEDDTVLARRLSRDGWRQVSEWKGRFVRSDFATVYEEMRARGLSSDEMLAESLERKLYTLSTRAGYVTEQPEVREKPGPEGRFTLVMKKEVWEFRTHYGFSVRDASTGGSTPLPTAEWADWDARGRLVYVGGGKVFAAEPGAGGTWTPRELADLNGNTPEHLVAPAWARKW
jgi:hypothetical protein